MLDLTFIRNNPQKIQANLINRNKQNIDIYEILKLDEQDINLKKTLQELYTQRKSAAQERDQEKGKYLKEKIAQIEGLQKKVFTKLQDLLLQLPNIPLGDVPIGKDENDNKILKKVGDIPFFNFDVKSHEILGKKLGIINTEKATEVAGSRFNYLIGDGAMLEYSLNNYAISVLTNPDIIEQIIKENHLDISNKAFIPIIPPNFINPETFLKIARLDPKEDRYFIDGENLYLIGSAEHTLGPIHMGEIISLEELPIRYFATTSCYRKEAGTYGKDMKGILRQHQFDKVEMVSFSQPEQALQEHYLFTAIQEYLVKSLELPYQQVLLCTGDMGTPDVRHVDIEVWLPGQNKYRETHSADYNTDYQSRRLNIRTIVNGKKQFVHINDGTAYALGRMIIAILENNQQQDGSILIPKVLQSYMKKEKITKR